MVCVVSTFTITNDKKGEGEARNLLFSWPHNSISLKCMLKLLYNLETCIMICIVKSRLSLHCVVFYNISKIALAL